MKTYCMGVECPVKNGCLRYTKGLGATMHEWTDDRFVRRCTNQRLYVQDSDRVNADSRKHEIV